MKYLYACLISIASAVGLSAQIIEFDLIGQGGSGLLGTNEIHATTTPGTGGEIGSGIFLDTATNILTINVGWGTSNSFTDLTGTATAAHIHGPFGQTEGGSTVFTLSTAGYSFATGASDGSIMGSVDLDGVTLGNASTMQDLLDGLWYINVHTGVNGSGEIRGNLVQVSAVPEPSTYAFLAGLGALGLVGTRRRRPVA
jgi:hypothetical protein